MRPNPLPRKQKPTASNAMLMTKLIDAAEKGMTRASTTAMPVTPPKEKLLGNLKK